MNIRQAAVETGLTADTIRYYERRGVLPQPARSTNGYRQYTASHLASLRLARGLRDLELPLDQVALIVGVAHDASCGDVRRALDGSIRDMLVQIDERIEKLELTRTRLRAIRKGIRSMAPETERVPGITPCACVQLVRESAH